MWKNLSIRKKLFCFFLVCALFISFVCFVTVVTGQKLVLESSRTLEKSMHIIRMGAKEADHLLWVSKVDAIIDSKNFQQIVSDLAEDQCELGLWLSGPMRQDFEKLFLENASALASLEVPHRTLHQVAARIVEHVNSGKHEEAKNLYLSSLLSSSQEVSRRINELRLHMIDELKQEQKALWVLLDDAKYGGVGIFLAFVVFSCGMCFLVNNSFYLPLQRIVDMTRCVGKGEWGKRLYMQRQDEIGEITSTLNETLDILCDKIAENEAKVEELLGLGAQLKAINKMAEGLLSQDDSDFDSSIMQALNRVGIATGVDRVFIWADKIGADNRRYCDQLYEWLGNAQPATGELVTDISYDDVIPGWAELFKQGKCVNGIVSQMSESERLQLEPQGILSVLTAPIILDGQVWGFIGYDNCHSERYWTDQEEEALRTAGVIVAAAIRRHGLMEALTEAKDRALDATTAKSEFLARMSHEIRTPMNAILGVSYIALQRELEEEVRRDFMLIRTSASSLMSIINDILDFSKIEARKMEFEELAFDLREALSNLLAVLRMKSSKQHVAMSCCVGEQVPDMVLGDPVRIRQVLLNLMSNALKFTERGGVHLEVVLLERSEDKMTLQFSVEDTGIGLSSAELARLFTPFSQSDGSITRRYGGTGLGLVICKELVEMMGGRMMVESDPGMGSFFSCILPLNLTDGTVFEKVDEPCENLEDQAMALTGKHILLVEDNEINSMIASTILEAAGGEVSFARNGLEAIEAVQEFRYDLILMDIQMPVMDGLEATRRIRKMPEVPEDMPIVAMTAHAMSSDHQKSLDAGMDAHVTKPIEPKDLIAVLTKLMRRNAKV